VFLSQQESYLYSQCPDIDKQGGAQSKGRSLTAKICYKLLERSCSVLVPLGGKDVDRATARPSALSSGVYCIGRQSQRLVSDQESGAPWSSSWLASENAGEMAVGIGSSNPPLNCGYLGLPDRGIRYSDAGRGQSNPFSCCVCSCPSWIIISSVNLGYSEPKLLRMLRTCWHKGDGAQHRRLPDKLLAANDFLSKSRR
jgi:hypothetical protein